MNTQPMNVIPMVIESSARGERALTTSPLTSRERRSYAALAALDTLSISAKASTLVLSASAL